MIIVIDKAIKYYSLKISSNCAHFGSALGHWRNQWNHIISLKWYKYPKDILNKYEWTCTDMLSYCVPETLHNNTEGKLLLRLWISRHRTTVEVILTHCQFTQGNKVQRNISILCLAKGALVMSLVCNLNTERVLNWFELWVNCNKLRTDKLLLKETVKEFMADDLLYID